MRNLKKFLALVLAMMMVFSLMVTANAADDSSMDAKYDDAYTTMEKYGVFIGMDDGKPELGEPFNRAMMATVIYRLATGDTNALQGKLYATLAQEEFDDVKETDWFAPYIGWCYSQGIILGYGNRTWGPDKSVTGTQVATMLLRMLGYSNLVNENWPKNVDDTARRVGITYGLTGVDLNDDATRGLAAYLVCNGALIPEQKVYVYGDKYEYAGPPLITVSDPVKAPSEDDFGALYLKTTQTVTFNWVYYGNETKRLEDDVDLVMYQFYTAKTECDVADEINLNGNLVLDTYTNGKGNKAQQRIEALDTVNTIGAEGRWTRIYDEDQDGVADRIVYVDTVLARVDSVIPATYDSSGKHVVKAATSNVTVYGNTAFQGVINDPLGNAEGSGAGWKASGGWKTSAPTAVVKTSSISGNAYPVGSLVTANVLTTTTGNTLSVNNTLKNPAPAAPRQVTIDRITYDGTTGSPNIIGFIGTDGQQYRYDVTYSYYNNATTDSGAITVLGQNSLKRTFDVYGFAADGVFYVLGLVPVTNAVNYGVVTSAKFEATGEVGHTDGGSATTADYVVHYTIKTVAGNEINITTKKSNAYFFNRTEAQGAAALNRALVKYELVDAVNNYYTVTAGGFGIADGTTNSPNNLVKANGYTLAGVAHALGSTRPLMDEDTIIFVESYTMGNASASTTTGSAYTISDYEVYHGIKDMPNDLGPTATAEIYSGTTLVASNLGGSDYTSANSTKLSFYAFDKDGNAITARGDGYARYVLILNGTQDPSKDQRAETVPTYAYIQHSLEENNVSDAFYEFGTVYQDSTAATSLKLNRDAGRTVTTNGTGLYVIKADSKGGTYSVLGNNKANYIGASIEWAYNAGVLDLKSGRTIANYNGGRDDYKNPTNGATNQTRFLTVADDARIYIVSGSNGKARLAAGYTLDTIARIYGGTPSGGYYTGVEMYFQTNQYGWIDVVYVVDKDISGSTTPPDEDPSLTIYHSPDVGWDGNFTQTSENSGYFDVTVPSNSNVYVETEGCDAEVETISNTNSGGKLIRVTVTNVTPDAYVIVNSYTGSTAPTDATDAEIEGGLAGGGGDGKLGGTHSGDNDNGVSGNEEMEELYDDLLGIKVDLSKAVTDKIIEIHIDKDTFENASNQERSRLVPNKGEDDTYVAKPGDKGYVGVNFDDGSGGDITNFTVDGVSKNVTKDDPWQYFIVAEYDETKALKLIDDGTEYVVRYQQGTSKYKFTVKVIIDET